MLGASARVGYTEPRKVRDACDLKQASVGVFANVLHEKFSHSWRARNCAMQQNEDEGRNCKVSHGMVPHMLSLPPTTGQDLHLLQSNGVGRAMLRSNSGRVPNDKLRSSRRQ